MSETDFIFAWLLATKAGMGRTALSSNAVQQLINEARDVYRDIKQTQTGETDAAHSRTTD